MRTYICERGSYMIAETILKNQSIKIDKNYFSKLKLNNNNKNIVKKNNNLECKNN